MITLVDKVAVVSTLVLAASKAIQLKARNEAPATRRAIAEKIHIKQTNEFVETLENALVPFFEKQIQSASDLLLEMRGTKSKTTDDTADQLAKSVFTPQEWNLELFRIVIPLWVQATAEAMLTQQKIIEIDSETGIDKSKLDFELKVSTASELVTDEFGREGLGISDLILFDFASQFGDVSFYLATEFPQAMKDTIQRLLSETFGQPYWAEINKTTLSDISGFLRKGIEDGLSIEQMATNMVPSLIEEGRYALIRGRTIARTESAHSLNGARSEVINGVIRDTGFQTSLKEVWMSVLGDTTRATHADLDGVPADKDGLWDLGGVRVRWPGDINLPAGERINCLCTVLAEFGLTDTDADELRADYQVRLLQQQEEE